MFKALQPGEVVTLEMKVYIDEYDWTAFTEGELNSPYSLVTSFPVTFTVPETWNPVLKKVETLRAQEQELTDQYLKKKAVIQSRISDLPCLPAPTTPPAPSPTSDDDIPF